MNIQILSDLHFEFLSPIDRQMLVRRLDPTDVDVLVLAGDIADYKVLPDALDAICGKYQGIPVLAVAGNHEGYKGSLEGLADIYLQAQIRNPNLRRLEREIVVIDYISFAGTTMWFRNHPMNATYQHMLADFSRISDSNRIYAENGEAEVWLNQVLQNGVDVVITHHMPSYELVAPKYRGNPDLNRFFVSPIADEINPEYLPRLWIYGHTHTPTVLERDGCRFVCNPLGYPTESNQGWSARCIEHLK